jgi:hypothetical protein
LRQLQNNTTLVFDNLHEIAFMLDHGNTLLNKPAIFEQGKLGRHKDL